MGVIESCPHRFCTVTWLELIEQIQYEAFSMTSGSFVRSSPKLL
jgi:hypothetical protein